MNAGVPFVGSFKTFGGIGIYIAKLLAKLILSDKPI